MGLAVGVNLIAFDIMDVDTFNKEIVPSDPITRPIISDEKEGYIITYPTGYISWCPKSVFDKTYLKIDSVPAVLSDEFICDFAVIDESACTEEEFVVKTAAGGYTFNIQRNNLETFESIGESYRDGVKTLIDFVCTWGLKGLIKV